MTTPIHRFKHLQNIWGQSQSTPKPQTSFLQVNEDGVALPNIFDLISPNNKGRNRISKHYANIGMLKVNEKELNELKTLCEGIVIPTEPEYIKPLRDKKRDEVLNIAQASASHQNLFEFTLSHLVLASSYKDEELVKLIYKNGLGPESVSHQLGVPLVISSPEEEVKPDEICRWIINHSIESEVSIFDAICHFICEAKQISKFGVEPGLIVESIKNPFHEDSIFLIESLPKHLS